MTRIQASQRPSIHAAEAMIASLGYTPLKGASWEDAIHVYAFSAESHGPSTYGAPKATVHWSDGTLMTTAP